MPRAFSGWPRYIWCSIRAISASVNFYSEVNAAALGGQLRISYTREFSIFFFSSLILVRSRLSSTYIGQHEEVVGQRAIKRA